MAGLLDFSGSGGGLLDFLRNNALNQQLQTVGAPGDMAQYGQAPIMPQAPMQAPMQQNAQPSPLDNAQWPFGPIGAPQRNARPSPLDNAQWPAGPIGAPSQANAQMPVPQNPPPVIQAPPTQSQPSGGLGAGLSGFANNLHNGPIGALVGGIGSALGMQDRSTQLKSQEANLTAQALAAKGVDPLAIHAAVAAAAAVR